MTRDSVLKNTALALAGLLAALLVCEAALRLIYGDKFGQRPSFYVADEELGWISSPDLDNHFYGPDFKIAVKTDAEGCRLGKLGEVDYGKRLVVLCGDSYIFGWGVSTGETFASNLDELVHSASNGTMRVVNLGIGGYGTLQYYYRLLRFMRLHRTADVAAVIVMHAQNDAVDNLKSLGYHAGTWEVRNREGSSRSRSHLVNFIRYAGVAIGRKKEKAPGGKRGEGITDPYLQDVLFSHEYTRTNKEYPPNIDFSGRIVDFRDVSDEDWYLERLLQRRSMTRIQSELIQVGVEFMHYMIANRGMLIIHMTVPTMSDWYREELVRLLQDPGQSEGNTVLISREKYPDPAGFKGQVMNTHSGGHYTPAFNRYWAEKTWEILRSRNILPR